MTNEKQVVKGGFRSTLALIISIVAIVLAVMAFNKTGHQPDLKAEIKDLRARMERMKKETAEKVSKVRQETTKALEKFGIDIKKEESKP